MTLKRSIHDLVELMTLPLYGKHLMLTRFQEAECPLARALQEAGADVSILPLIQIRSLPFVLPSLLQYDWVFFTSQQAVASLGPSLQVFQKTTGMLPKLGVVGAATAASLEAFGLQADFLPQDFHARAAAEAFVQEQPTAGLQILWPCGSKASLSFAEIFRNAGAMVEPLVVYETLSLLPERQAPGVQALCRGAIDLLVFTSPSAVEAFFRLQDTLVSVSCEYASLGPSTSQAIQALLGRVPVVEAKPHTFQGLLESVCLYYQSSQEIT